MQSKINLRNEQLLENESVGLLDLSLRQLWNVLHGFNFLINRRCRITSSRPSKPSLSSLFSSVSSPSTNPQVVFTNALLVSFENTDLSVIWVINFDIFAALSLRPE